MKYFFILGTNKTLSIAEIISKFPDAQHHIQNDGVLFLTTNHEIDPRDLISKLGGTIKIGIIHNTLKSANKDTFSEIFKILNPEPGSKFKFGISYYGKNKFNPKPLAMETKKYLKEQNTSSRWVTSKENTLSSVVVEQNKLTSNGIELVFIQDKNQFHLGKTLAVQPFKSLSFRDFGRPARDDHSGMLPPKLAQILINLATQNKQSTILDPFCGSGTILTEAILMGFINIIGSDISPKAINDTQSNINWIQAKYQTPKTNIQLINSSSLELSKTIKSNSIDAIITEPYLGPQRGKIDIKKTITELNTLYSNSLKEFSKILKPSSTIVIIFPILIQDTQKHFLTPITNDLNIINPLPPSLQNNSTIKLTKRNTIIYSRPNQKIEREIVIFKK